MDDMDMQRICTEQVKVIVNVHVTMISSDVNLIITEIIILLNIKVPLPLVCLFACFFILQFSLDVSDWWVIRCRFNMREIFMHLLSSLSKHNVILLHAVPSCKTIISCLDRFCASFARVQYSSDSVVFCLPKRITGKTGYFELPSFILLQS